MLISYTLKIQAINVNSIIGVGILALCTHCYLAAKQGRADGKV